MLNIKDKIIDYSENVETAIDQVSLKQPNQVIVQHRIGVKVTFKDWWDCFLEKDLLHVSIKTVIDYENADDVCAPNKSHTDKPKKSRKTATKSDTNTGE